MTGPPPRIAAVAADTEAAQQALIELCSRYSCVPPERADIIVSLGGDGFMLETLHRTIASRKPVYGMNRGSVGFLMNDYNEENLLERIERAMGKPVAREVSEPEPPEILEYETEAEEAVA